MSFRFLYIRKSNNPVENDKESHKLKRSNTLEVTDNSNSVLHIGAFTFDSQLKNQLQ